MNPETVVINSDFIRLGAYITPFGLELPPNLDYAAWADLGDSLGRFVRLSQWMIGDWLLYGEARFGETYAQALESTGLDYGTLANAKWTARRIPPERRRANLSYSHHVEVAKLPEHEQDRMLELAAPESGEDLSPRLSVRELRQAVKDLVEPDGPPPLPEPVNLLQVAERLRETADVCEVANSTRAYAVLDDLIRYLLALPRIGWSE